MEIETKNFPKHMCQICGAETKLVETVVDDEFIWDEKSSEYVPNGYTDNFEHTGNNRCAECGNVWTGQ